MNEDQRKLLQTNAQQLINPEQKGMKNKFLSWLLKDSDIDVLNVKHLDVYGKNTLTTPKIVVSDSSADPVNDGEITRNGTTLKVKTAGSVINIGRAMLLDTEQFEDNIPAQNPLSGGCHADQNHIANTYSVKESTTITVAEDDSIVALAGACSSGGGIASDTTIKITEGGVTKVSEDTMVRAGDKMNCHGIGGIITGVSSGSHTYDLQCKISLDSPSAGFGGYWIYAGIVKLV